MEESHLGEGPVGTDGDVRDSENEGEHCWLQTIMQYPLCRLPVPEEEIKENSQDLPSSGMQK